MLHVHVAENHQRELPEPMLAAASREMDLDRRIRRMVDVRRGSRAGAGHEKAEVG
jgi:hypothetical protein